jgi:hypothetical protein
MKVKFSYPLIEDEPLEGSTMAMLVTEMSESEGEPTDIQANVENETEEQNNEEIPVEIAYPLITDEPLEGASDENPKDNRRQVVSVCCIIHRQRD